MLLPISLSLAALAVEVGRLGRQRAGAYDIGITLLVKIDVPAAATSALIMVSGNAAA